MTDSPAPAQELGPNAGLIDEMYRLYQDEPAGGRARVARVLRGLRAPRPAPPRPTAPPPPAPAPPHLHRHRHRRPQRPHRRPRPSCSTATSPQPLRGAAARIVTNMEASLQVPTATSVRRCPPSCSRSTGRSSTTTSPARAAARSRSRTSSASRCCARCELVTAHELVVRRRRRQARGRAARRTSTSASRSTCRRTTARARCSSRTSSSADTLDFAAFHAAYEELIRKARDEQARRSTTSPARRCRSRTPARSAPMHSVPRLMPGQGVIVGVGAISYPVEYEGADPQTLAEIGISKVVTLTSTYDHRVIQGAESGEFLGHVHELLVGEHDFYDGRLRELRRAVRAGPVEQRPQAARGLDRGASRRRSRSRASSTCTACAVTSSRTSTRSG